VAPPIAAETAGDDPEELIPVANRWSRPRPEGDRELVAQQQVHEGRIAAAPQEGTKDAEQEGKQFDHDPEA
jgi:hypothetical protein